MFFLLSAEGSLVDITAYVALHLGEPPVKRPVLALKLSTPRQPFICINFVLTKQVKTPQKVVPLFGEFVNKKIAKRGRKVTKMAPNCHYWSHFV